MVDATLTVLEVLRDNWDPTAVADRNGGQVLADQPPIHSGTYDRNGPKPAVAVHSKDEGPTSGGETGLYGHAPSGLGMQLIAGALSIDFVAGSRAECENVGPDGESKNPKQVREAMAAHGARLLLANQRGTALRTLAPGDAREIEDTQEGPTSFRIQQRVRYTYTRQPPASSG